MAWVYKVNDNAFYLNGTFKFNAMYSGRPGYKNNTPYECVQGKGPLPRGTYHISEPFYHHKTKAWTMRLTPSASNHMCGRDGFLIHGGSSKHPGEASDGCIIATIKERKDIAASGDHTLIVE
ncbi:DUF2778 domain-containing protein [Rahnella perminowiae]|uniref:tlde1 domain-containing protein n=1 Tax=Rahnella perminowiae TaxID=2816244 RepID=UPI00224B37BB|nr:tlde1 domain-containing protein [Rahnella perminowiae]MCX2943856.1 DUF2778 domain-containing protein [Rahnella perminowiae]